MRQGAELVEDSRLLRIRSREELSLQFEGLVALSLALDYCLNNWFLSGGTLLGALREGDFIPWDWDVEVTVLTEEARKKRKHLIASLEEIGFEVLRVDRSRKNFKIVAGGYGTEFEILGRYLVRRGANTYRARRITKVSSAFFENPATVTFRGKSFPAPSPPETYLTELYGDWQTPKMTNVHAEYLSDNSYTPPSYLRFKALWWWERIKRLIRADGSIES